MLETILQLKRTLVPGMPGAMTWREIGKRLGISSQAAFKHAKKLKDLDCRCQGCLRKLEKEKMP